MNRFTIILNDGKRLENLTQNGTMFVSATEVTEADFNVEALKAVTIIETDDTGVSSTVEMKNAVCDGILHWPEGWLFNLREQTASEKMMDMTNVLFALLGVNQNA